jgi:superfamily I DNA/RNA helicase
VLVRVNDQLAALERALLASGQPVTVLGAVPFTTRAGVRDALAAIALVGNPRDRLAFARTAAAAGRGVGPAACRALFAHADRHPERTLLEHGATSSIAGLGARQADALRELCARLLAAARLAPAGPRPVSTQVIAALVASAQPERLHRTLAGTGNAATRGRARRQLRNLRNVVARARAYETRAAHPRLGEFIAELALEQTDRTVAGGAVALSTVHRAKGLEFDHVWLAGVEEGLLPHARALRVGHEPEERRLAYVAVTRARHTLHLSWARRRKDRPREPSRYLPLIAGCDRPAAAGAALQPASARA